MLLLYYINIDTLTSLYLLVGVKDHDLTIIVHWIVNAKGMADDRK